MWFRKRTDKDFRTEVESHIRLEADRLIAEGMPPADAEFAARRAFGNVALVREKFYESRRWLWLEQLTQDLRYGLRTLRKAPAFAVAVVLTIALGVGANTAIFSLMDEVLLRSLPVHNPQALVFIETEGTAGSSGAPPYPCFTRLRAETSAFSGIAAFATDELRIEVEGKPEQVMGQVASGNYFELLGMKAAAGRLMDASDEKLNPPVAVISDRYWRSRFGGDPGVIGKTFSFRKQAFTIVGVTPAEFWGLEPGRPIDITMPISTERNLLADSGAWWFSAVARLNPGAPVTVAQSQTNAVFQSFIADSRQPAEMIRQYFHHLALRPAAQGLSGLRTRFSKPLYALMAIASLVLLMATANIANLLLARGISRRREFAIRLATGAGRMRLVRQLLTEILLLFGLGAISGLLFARSGVMALELLFAQGRRPIIVETNLNWRVLAFTMTVAVAAALMAALFPVLRAFNTDPEEAIKEGQSRTSESRGSATLTRTLVAFQVALTLILLVGAATFVRTLSNLRDVNLGFQNEDVLTMSVELPDGYAQPDKSIEFWNQTLAAVREIPGARTAGLAIFTPLSGRDRGAQIQVRGYEPASVNDTLIRINHITEGYFETLGTELLAGRLITEADAKGSPKVAVINESAARKYFANRDPLGQSIEFLKGRKVDSAYSIVGVVRDTKHMSLREPVPPFAFLPLRQPRDSERRVTLAVTSMLPNGQMSFLQPIRSRIAKIEPRALVSEVLTIRGQVDSTLLTERILSQISTAFGLLALTLASIGLYGVLSYHIGQQRQSIGIRMALGASPSSVALNVMRQSGVVIAAGLLCGMPFAYLAARAAESMLWGVKSTDPMIYMAGIALLSVVGFLSAGLPARRASNIEPSEALRHG